MKKLYEPNPLHLEPSNVFIEWSGAARITGQGGGALWALTNSLKDICGRASMSFLIGWGFSFKFFWMKSLCKSEY